MTTLKRQTIFGAPDPHRPHRRRAFALLVSAITFTLVLTLALLRVMLP